MGISYIFIYVEEYSDDNIRISWEIHTHTHSVFINNFLRHKTIYFTWDTSHLIYLRTRSIYTKSSDYREYDFKGTDGIKLKLMYFVEHSSVCLSIKLSDGNLRSFLRVFGRPSSIYT